MGFFKRRISSNRYFYVISGLSILIIFSSIVLAIYTIANTNRTLSLLDRTHQINTSIEKIMATLRDAVTAQSGYIITGKPIFWLTFDKARSAMDLEFENLYDKLKEDERQRIKLDFLAQELKTQISLLEESKLYFDEKQNIDDTLRQMIYESRASMEKVRMEVRNIQLFEQERLKSIQDKVFSSSRLSIYIIILTCGSSLLLLVVILTVLNREYNAKAKVEMELTASEKRLQQQVHKLNLSNKELEQFAYVASHDLQEPLRKIISFSEKIKEKLDGRKDEEIENFLGRLNKSAARMSTLIQDLLNYSRATRSVEPDQTINLNNVLRVILEDLEVLISTKKAKVQVGNLGLVVGNETQLRQLFQNLITNALKFNTRPTPVISIEGSNSSDYEIRKQSWGNGLNLKYSHYYCILVSDNGIGFDSQYKHQIFNIFQRLHGRSEYEGTGIGLAICKRIVENHDGFITAEGFPDKGATFIVGLPKIYS